MAAITDPDELANAQAQMSAQTPPVPPGMAAPAPSAGPIRDPDELAHVRAQLQDVSKTPAIASPPVAATASSLPGAVMEAPPDRGIGGAIEDGIRMLVAPVMGNRAAAALDTATGTGLPGADYAKNLANETAKTNWVQSQHPYEAQVLGGVAPIGAGLAAVAAAPEEGLLGAATFGGRSLYSALTGGGVSGVNAASAEPDLTAPGAAGRVATATALGMGGGAAAPLVGAGLGAAYNAGANALNGGVEGMSRGASSKILPFFESEGPAAVTARNAVLGPLGNMADSSPAMMTTLQGAVVNSPEARSIAQNAFEARDAGTNARMLTALHDAIGPEQDPMLASLALQAQRSQIHSALPAIFNAAPNVDTTGVLSTIGQGLVRAVGPEAAVLGKARDWLMRDGYDAAGNPIRVPVTDAETLQNAKMSIDTLIDRGDPSLGVQPGAVAKSQGAIGAVRTQLNQALRSQVPGYSDVMDRSAALASRMDAIDKGNTILGSGATTISPAFLQSQLADKAAGGLGPNSPLLNELQGLRTGINGDIYRTVGLKANDLAALKTKMQGEGGWNAAKIGTVFGSDAPTGISAAVDQNQTFRNTMGDVYKSVQTASRLGAADAMKPAAATGGIPLINPNMSLTGLIGTGAKNIGTMLANQLRPDPTRAYGEISRILTAQGPQRDAYTQAMIDALTRRGSNAATAATVQDLSGKAALAAALMAAPRAGQQLGPQQ